MTVQSSLAASIPIFIGTPLDSESLEDGEDDFEEVQKKVIIMSEAMFHPSGMRKDIEEEINLIGFLRLSW